LLLLIVVVVAAVVMIGGKEYKVGGVNQGEKGQV
jgi:hypothetical protein